MPLNIEVKADIGGLRDLANWFGTSAEAVHNAGTAVIGARIDAEAEWGGASGEAFHRGMSKAGTGIDGVADDMAAAGAAVSTFTDDMATAKSRMEQARQVAAEGGLEVTQTEIKDPGPAPAAPTPLPADGSATLEQHQAFTTAQSAVAEHQTKVNAFNQASQIVNEARGTETVAQSQLAKFGNEQYNKAPFTFTDIFTGLTAAAITRTSKFRGLAASYGRYAERALRIAMSKPITDPAFIKAAQLNAQFMVKQRKLLDDAVKSLPVKALDKLPRWAKTTLIAELGDFNALKGGSTAAWVGKAVLGKIPIVGIAITAASIGVDIAEGKNPVQSVASGVSGLDAGAAVGAAIGGPVGVVVGAAVGAGVGYVVDEWGDDIAKGAGDGAKAVGGAIADGTKAVGKFVDDLF
jgi:uncharacterized protein YukE